MGWEESPHGILLGSVRRGVRGRRALFGSGSGTGQATQARQGPHLHGCSGCDYADDARRPWPRTDLHPSGEAGDSSPAQTGTCRRDRDPLVPGAQWNPRKRGRGRVGQIGRQRTGRLRGRVAGACRRHPAARTTDLPSAPRTQGVGKEVAGSPVVVRAETPQQGVCAPEERKT